MTDHSFQPPAPAASSAAGAAAASNLTADDNLSNALAAMHDALETVKDAGESFQDAADLFYDVAARVEAGVAALRASLAPPAGAAPNGLVHMTGPWTSGKLYGVVPLAPLSPIPDASTDRWYSITRGTYVGLTRNSAISLNAVTGVSTGLSEKFSSQTEALDHFNTALALNAIAVIF